MYDCDSRCDSELIHEFYAAGGGFKWCFPRVVNMGGKTAYNAPRFKTGFNRYPHNIIGFGVCLFGRQYVLNWKK